MRQGGKTMQVLNMGDPVPKKDQFLKLFAGNQAVDFLDEIRAEVQNFQVKQIPKPDHPCNLVLGEVQDPEFGQPPKMGDIGQTVDRVIEFLKV